MSVSACVKVYVPLTRPMEELRTKKSPLLGARMLNGGELGIPALPLATLVGFAALSPTPQSASANHAVGEWQAQTRSRAQSHNLQWSRAFDIICASKILTDVLGRLSGFRQVA